MSIKWKKGFDPDVVFQALKESINFKKMVVSDSVEVNENMSTLTSMIEFDDDIYPYRKNQLVLESFLASAQTKRTRQNFENEINKKLSDIKVEVGSLQEFRLLTTISIKPPFKFSDFPIDDCSIRFIEGPFPKMYDSRKDLLKNDHRKTNDDDENQYCKVIVSTTSPGPRKALKKCIDALDLLRALLSMKYNDSRENFLNSYACEPPNMRILGKYATLHTETGESVPDLYWFNPHYVKVSPFHIVTKDESIIKKEINRFFSQLDKLKVKVEDRKKIKRAMIRFLYAYDHTDYTSTIIEGWGSLEYLVLNENEFNTAAIVRRCSLILAKDTLKDKLYEQHMNSIREYRNRIVHDRELPEASLIVCYQLQRIFYKIIRFYLDYADEFDTLEKINEYLDLPSNISELNELQTKLLNELQTKLPNERQKELHNKQQLIQRAIKYLTPSEDK